MSEYRDFEEKSIEKALEKACRELGVPPEKLRYDIISHGSSGIFGLVGAKKAIIRVLMPKNKTSDESANEVKQGPGDAGKESKQEDKTASALVDEAFGPSPIEAIENESEESSSPDLQGLDRQGLQAAVEWTNGFIDRVVALISPDSKINIKNQGDVIRFEINGGDSARMIGKRGQTLDAIHYLVERGVYKQFGTSVPIEIDVEGYLEKRRADLTELASRLAEKARQTGKPMVINRINAQDRRVVHLNLRDNTDVRTQSVGNGDFRKLLILPKKKTQTKHSNSGDQ
ncbi:MAG: RNA-binding cell elongation regulator Jag/EloR [Thermodesulfobacteriota bacterium]